MKNLDYLFVLICTFLARIIIFGASFSEALVFIACISYILLNKYLDDNRVVKYNTTIDEKLTKIEEDVQKTLDSVAAVRIGNTFSTQKK